MNKPTDIDLTDLAHVTGGLVSGDGGCVIDRFPPPRSPKETTPPWPLGTPKNPWPEGMPKSPIPNLGRSV